MKVILITGMGDCGKSFAIFHSALWLSSSYDECPILRYNSCLGDSTYNPGYSDLRTLFQKEGHSVMFHSATDDAENISILKENLIDLEWKGIIPDILVTTCRRFDDDNAQTMHKTLGWKRSGHKLYNAEGEEIIQIPVLRVKYEWDKDGVIEWYNELTTDLVCKCISLLLEELK